MRTQRRGRRSRLRGASPRAASRAASDHSSNVDGAGEAPVAASKDMASRRTPVEGRESTKAAPSTATASAGTPARGNGLLSIHSVPEHFRYNKYIRQHYRPLLSPWQCIASAFTQVSNETGNVLTHALPLLVAVPFLAYLGQTWDQRPPQYVLLVPAVLCMCLVLTLSSAYHLFMAATATRQSYERLLALDVFGIWLLQTVAGTISVVYGFVCTPVAVTSAVSVLTPAVGLVLLWRAKKAGDRAVAFGLMAAARTLCNVARATFGTGSGSAVAILVAAEALVAFGGVINAARFPERVMAPGSRDLLFNSHQLMHLLTAGGMAVLTVAVHDDCDHIARVPELQRCADAAFMGGYQWVRVLWRAMNVAS